VVENREGSGLDIRGEAGIDMSSSKRVLIIDNSLDPSVYRPVTHWVRHFDSEFEAVAPPAGVFPADLEEFSHVIITGSEASVLDDDPWIVHECELIVALSKMQIPILASCFAHQLVVRALSGKKFVRRAPRPEFGWLEVLQESSASDEDPLFKALPQSFHLFSSHFDEVHPLSKAWQRLAFSMDCANAAIKWRKGPVWGIQHHPEINFEDADTLLRMIPEIVPERARQFQRGLRRQKRDSEVTGDLVKAFLAI